MNSPAEQARLYLAKIPGGVEKQAGSTQTFLAAKSLVEGFALDDDAALTLLSDWNSTCSPPWSESDLRHKITDARKAIDSSRLGSKIRRALTGDPVADWATLRGFSERAVRDMGGEAHGADCVAFSLWLGGKVVGHRLRRADGSKFEKAAAKAITPRGERLGVLLSSAMREPIPTEATVCLTEGEPNACALADAGAEYVLGLPCAPGSKDVLEEVARLLKGHSGPVIIFGDAGAAGEKLVANVARALAAVGVELRVVPGIEGADLDERLAKEIDRPGALAKLIEGAKAWTPMATAATDTATATGAAANDTNTAEKSPVAMPSIMSAVELEHADLPATRWIADGYLPEGQAALAGRPKSGKSFLALQLGVDVARGQVHLGRFKTLAGDVLHLGLEDSLARIKSRLRSICGGDSFPARLHIATEWPRLDRGGIDAMRQWLADHPDARLVTIDTLAKIRPPKDSRGDSYEQDYCIGAILQRMALENHVAIVCLMHTRKAQADDVFDTVSGTLGQTAAADVIAILQRTRGTNRGELHATGRDISEMGFSVEFQDSRWLVTGELDGAVTSAAEKAVAWLTKHLRGGGQTSKDISAAARAEGIAKDALWEAKAALGIKAHKNGLGHWEWRLPPVSYNDPSDASENTDASDASDASENTTLKHPGGMDTPGYIKTIENEEVSPKASEASESYEDDLKTEAAVGEPSEREANATWTA